MIIWGQYAERWGGGLCQVSSTIYNAVLRAKLKVVERHYHAKPIHYVYVPKGRDHRLAEPQHALPE